MQQQSHPDLGAAWRRGLAAVPALVALMIWTPGLNDIEPAKLLLITMVAGILLAAWVFRALRLGELLVPTGPFTALLGVGIVALLTSTVLSGYLQMGLFGTRSRYDGLLLYLAAGICALSAARALGQDPQWRLGFVTSLATIGAVVGAIGLLQAAGYVPFGMRSDVDGAFSTLGNPNFLAGWAGAVSGVPLALLLWERDPAARVKWGVLFLALAGGAVASGSTQWIGSAGASCGAAVTLWVTSRTSGRRRAALLAGVAVAGVAGLTALGAGLAGIGPLSGISGDIGTRLRGHYWRAASQMAADNPLFGVGPGRFIWEYRGARSPVAAADVSITSVADAAHNVWLNFLAVGGIATAVAFLGLLLLSGWAIRRVLQQVEPASPHRAAIAGLAAVEAGYLVQSLVSIEVPSLVVLHLMTAGVLAGAAGTVGWRTMGVRVPGTKQVRTAVAGVGGLAVVIAAVMIGGRPLRAEQSAEVGVRGSGEGAVAALQTTTERAPWEPYYQELLANKLLDDDNLDDALMALARADELADPNGTARIRAAVEAAEADRVEDASRLFAAALEVEPNHPDLHVRYSRFLAANGDVDAALSTVEQLLTQFPDNAEALALRDDLQEEAGG